MTLGALGCLALALMQPPVPDGPDGFLLRGWRPLEARTAGLIAVQAACAVIGVGLITRAYLLAEAAFVAVFEYTLLIFGGFWGWVLWGQGIDAPGLLGIVLIIASGVVLTRATRAPPVAHRVRCRAMIISPGRRYIFVHAPKTGGTAMALALEARAMKDDIMVGDTPKAVARKGRLKDLGCGTATDQAFDAGRSRRLSHAGGRCRAFSSSCWCAIRGTAWSATTTGCGTQSFKHPAVFLSKRFSFDRFVTQPMIGESMRKSNYARYVTDARGGERCDLFVRLEHLAADIAPLEAHLGFALNMPHVNRSDRAADYRSYYTDATRDRVAEMSRADIDRFGYSFD